MHTWLLTWNPRRWQWTGLAAGLESSRNGGNLRDKWSCGKTRRIEVGSRFFLLKQGPDPAGLVGSGRIVGPPYSAPHWSGQGAASYVDVELDSLLLEPLISRSALLRDDDELRGTVWKTQSSGVRIPPSIATALEKRWEKLTKLS